MTKVIQKYLVRFIGAFFVLVALVLIFLSNNVFYKHLPTLISYFSSINIQSEIEGHFFTQQNWKNTRISHNDFNLEIDSLSFDWNWKDLVFQKKINIDYLGLKNSNLQLFDSHQKEEEVEHKALVLPERIETPINIEIKLIEFLDFNIINKDRSHFAINEFHASASFFGHFLKLDYSVKTHKFDHNLSSSFDLANHYPMDIVSKLTSSTYEVDLKIKNSLFQPEIDIQTIGDIETHLKSRGEFDLQNNRINMPVYWDKISYLGKNIVQDGEALIHGTFDKINLNLKTLLNLSKKTLPISINITTTPEKLENINLLAQAEHGTLSLVGQMDYKKQILESKLIASEFNLSNYLSSYVQSDLQIKSLNLDFFGNLNEQDFLLNIHNLHGLWSTFPFEIIGAAKYDRDFIHFSEVSAYLSENKLNINGKIGNNDKKSGALNLILDASKLEKINAKLKGKIFAQFDLNGHVLDPYISGNINWSNLSYFKEKKDIVFSSDSGQINVKGDWADGMDTEVQLKSNIKNLSDINLYGLANIGVDKIKNIDIKGELLGGRANISGNIDYKNQAWILEGFLDKIDVSKIESKIKSNLSLDFSSQSNGKESISLTIKNIQGNFNKEKINGNIDFLLSNYQNLKGKLDLSLGKNEISGIVDLSQQNMNINVNTQIPNLALFYPDLKGSLHSDLILGGNIDAPEINAKIKGKGFVYHDIKIDDLDLNIDSAFQKGGKFNSHFTFKKIKINDKDINQVLFSSQGLFDAHSATFKIILNKDEQVELVIHGGFKPDWVWRGEIDKILSKINQHIISNERSGLLSFGNKEMILENLCIKDNFNSRICIDVQKKEGLNIAYDVSHIDGQSISSLLKEKIKTRGLSLSGKGFLHEKKGNYIGEGKFNTSLGKIIIPLGSDAPPIVLDIKSAHLDFLFNNKKTQAQLKLNSNLGKIDGDLFLDHLNAAPKIKSYLHIDIPDLNFMKNRIPKISQLKGKVLGKISIVGDLHKPEVNGEIGLKEGAFKIPEYAADFKDIYLTLHAEQDGAIGIKGNLKTPEGSMKTTGRLNLSPLKLDLKIQGQDMLLANSKTMKIYASPDFNIAMSKEHGVNIKGKLLIPDAKIDIPDTSSAVSISKDVVIVNEKHKHQKENQEKSTPFSTDMEIKLGDKVYFKNKDVNIKLIGGLNIKSNQDGLLLGEGRIKVANGLYYLYGQELNIKRGWVTFSGYNIANPMIDFRASRKINDDIEVGAVVTGAAKRLSLKLDSEPKMPDSFIVSYLLFGKAPDGSVSSSDLLNIAANMAVGQFTSGFAESLNLDVFSLNISGLKVGKNITQDLYLGLNNDFVKSITQFVGRYRFNKRLRLEASASEHEKLIDFTYEYEKD